MYVFGIKSENKKRLIINFPISFVVVVDGRVVGRGGGGYWDLETGNNDKRT